MSSPFRIPSSCSEGYWEDNEADPRRWIGDHRHFPEGFRKPRTCSFCGGAHPDDVMELIKAGWEVDPSDKSYKTYVHPPGNVTQTYKDLERNFVQDPLTPMERAQRIRDVTPPIKLYAQHISPEQLAELNTHVLISRAKRTK